MSKTDLSRSKSVYLCVKRSFNGINTEFMKILLKNSQNTQFLAYFPQNREIEAKCQKNQNFAKKLKNRFLTYIYYFIEEISI